MQQVRSHSEYSHPHDWAALIVLGAENMKSSLREALALLKTDTLEIRI